MERLSSCYFCGDAVDAALEEYPLVHSDRYDELDTDQRIVLCPSCRRKLTTVIERVLETAFDGGHTSGADTPVSDEESEDPLIDVGGEDAMTASSVTAIDDAEANGQQESARDSSGFEYGPDDGGEDTDTAADSGADDTAADSDADETVTDAEADDAVSGSEAFETVAGSEADDTAAGSEAGDTTAQAQTDDTTSESETGDTAAESESDDEDDAPEYTFERWQFNKVVRLLQNREFPVDIDELTILADSAYEIDEPTTHEIIDALVERGVVVDNGDTLTRA